MTSLSNLAVRAALCAGLISAPAYAHITFENATATIGGTWKAIIRIPHGCDGSATRGIKINLPEGVFNAKPMPKAGWVIAMTRAPYGKSYNEHGATITEGARDISWSGGHISDSEYDEFIFVASISADLTAPQKLIFPTEQICDKGHILWNASPEQKSATPAPVLQLIGDTSKTETVIKSGDLLIMQAWSRATPNGAPVAGGYLRITNTGSSPDHLLGGSTPAGTSIEVHEMSMKDGIMTMRPIDGGLEIGAGASVELKPGGNHLMIMGLKSALREGDHVPITLTFEKAGAVTLDLIVRAMNAQNAGETPMDHDHMNHLEHMNHMEHMH
jgi:periplasmic copper chaperone A